MARGDLATRCADPAPGRPTSLHALNQALPLLVLHQRPVIARCIGVAAGAGPEAHAAG